MLPPAFVLPVSGACVTLRPLDGQAELLLAEGDPADPALALALLNRLAASEAVADWRALPVHDVDVLITRLRQAEAGDRVVAELLCREAGCGTRVDLSFGLEIYLQHHRPRGSAAALPIGEAPGWWRLKAEGTRFRPPVLGDQIAVARLPDPAVGMMMRCLPDDAGPPTGTTGTAARGRRRAEAALAAIAPPLGQVLGGDCPECGTAINAWFEPRLYCLQDLCARARFMFDDVDLLAERYHWSEPAILRLPRARRARYVERALAARVA